MKLINLIAAAMFLTLSCPASAQTDEEWFRSSVFFNAFTPEVQKCIQAHAKSRDYREFLLCSERLSASGDRSADMLTGYFYWKGWYTPMDHKAAADLWERSYQRGFTNAAIFVAMPYALKLGRPRDVEKARALRRQFALTAQQEVEELVIKDAAQNARLTNFIGRVKVSYTVGPTGKVDVSTCLATGGDPYTNKEACWAVGRSKFLPALSREGVPISAQRTATLVWNKDRWGEYSSALRPPLAGPEAWPAHPEGRSSVEHSSQPSGLSRAAISKDGDVQLEAAI